MNIFSPPSNMDKLQRMGYEFKEQEGRLHISNLLRKKSYSIKTTFKFGELFVTYDLNLVPEIINSAIFEMIIPQKKTHYATIIENINGKKSHFFDNTDWQKTEENQWTYVGYPDLEKQKEHILSKLHTFLLQCQEEHPLFLCERYNHFFYRGEEVRLEFVYQNGMFLCEEHDIGTEEQIKAFIRKKIDEIEKRTRLKQLYAPSLTYITKLLNKEVFGRKMVNSIIEKLQAFYSHEEMELRSAKALKIEPRFEYDWQKKSNNYARTNQTLNVRIIENERGDCQVELLVRDPDGD